MNLAAGSFPVEPAGPVRGALRFAWYALRSVTRKELLFAAAVGLALGVVVAMLVLEHGMKKPHTSLMLAMEVVLPLLCTPFALAAWLLADRAHDSGLPRALRLALACIGGAVAAGLVLPGLALALGLPVGRALLEDGREIQIAYWVQSSALVISVFTYSALAVVPVEWHRRRVLAQAALDASLREQAALSRQVLESRLAAMQAQVEPQFLFDTLVGIEQLYARDAALGSSRLDRLIAYLRVALPRLREAGSTIGAEIELVQSYLGVVQAGADGTAPLRLAVEPAAAQRVLHPMLLLPLVQRAVRDTAGSPLEVEIVAKAMGDATVIVLRFARGGLCEDDEELRRVQGRLHALYGHGATLHCDATHPDRTEFTLRLPAE